jgi:pyruvate kinase
MMVSICREAEADIDYTELYAGLRRHIRLPISISESIASVAVKTAWDVHAPLIIALTEKGNTARAICKYRPIPPVIGATADARVARQFQVLRGIYPFLTETMQGTENVVVKAMFYGVQLGLADKGDHVVITSGNIEAVSGSTNMMKVAKCIGFEV